jgi:hypothetical protein
VSAKKSRPSSGRENATGSKWKLLARLSDDLVDDIHEAFGVDDLECDRAGWLIKSKPLGF